jgi:uncharacterized protein YidB (DUF937 family)
MHRQRRRALHANEALDGVRVTNEFILLLLLKAVQEGGAVSAIKSWLCQDKNIHLGLKDI